MTTEEPTETKKFEHPLYRRYYLLEDVEPHSTPEDCWFVVQGKVLDLSPLMIAKKGNPLCRPLTLNAGTDISHWFDGTGNPKQYVDVESATRKYYLPQGRYLHVPSDLPEPIDIDFEEPWWRDPKYIIGHLTTKKRNLRIINTLTHHEEFLEVPAEETLNEIQTRYLAINSHSKSYTWKDSFGTILDLSKTLAENDIEDEDPEADYLSIPDDERYIPSILIYFNDDLTEA